jgi:predicted HNH restriction endonuclease
MARPPRLEFKGALYHVMTCGIATRSRGYLLACWLKDSQGGEIATDKEFAEGVVLLRLHRHRERSSVLRKKKLSSLPLSEAKSSCSISLDDLMAVYANCHRAIYSFKAVKENTGMLRRRFEVGYNNGFNVDADKSGAG